MPHNFFYLRHWVTEDFYKHHVLEVAEEDPQAKKRAEVIFQKRRTQSKRRKKDWFQTNTLLCLSAKQGASSLIAEVRRRQLEYQAGPQELYVTEERYPYYQRGGEDAGPQRARFMGLAYLIYAVDDVESPGFFKICHLEGMSLTPISD